MLKFSFSILCQNILSPVSTDMMDGRCLLVKIVSVSPCLDFNVYRRRYLSQSGLAGPWFGPKIYIFSTSIKEVVSTFTLYQIRTSFGHQTESYFLCLFDWVLFTMPSLPISQGESRVFRMAGRCVPWHDLSITQPVISHACLTLLGQRFSPPHSHPHPQRPCSPDMSGGWWVCVPLEVTLGERERECQLSFVVCDSGSMCDNIYIGQVHGSLLRSGFPQTSY